MSPTSVLVIGAGELGTLIASHDWRANSASPSSKPSPHIPIVPPYPSYSALPPPLPARICSHSSSNST